MKSLDILDSTQSLKFKSGSRVTSMSMLESVWADRISILEEKVKDLELEVSQLNHKLRYLKINSGCDLNGNLVPPIHPPLQPYPMGSPYRK